VLDIRALIPPNAVRVSLLDGNRNGTVGVEIARPLVHDQT